MKFISFEIKKILLQGDATYVGTSATVPPKFELVMVAGNQAMQIYVGTYTTLAKAKLGAAAVINASTYTGGTALAWTDAGAGSVSAELVRPTAD